MKAVNLQRKSKVLLFGRLQTFLYLLCQAENVFLVANGLAYFVAAAKEVFIRMAFDCFSLDAKSQSVVL